MYCWPGGADAPAAPAPNDACFEVWFADAAHVESFELSIAYSTRLVRVEGQPVTAAGIGAHCLLTGHALGAMLTIASACPQPINGTGAVARFWVTSVAWKGVGPTAFAVSRCVIDEDAERCQR